MAKTTVIPSGMNNNAPAIQQKTGKNTGNGQRGSPSAVNSPRSHDDGHRELLAKATGCDGCSRGDGGVVQQQADASARPQRHQVDRLAGGGQQRDLAKNDSGMEVDVTMFRHEPRTPGSSARRGSGDQRPMSPSSRTPTGRNRGSGQPSGAPARISGRIAWVPWTTASGGVGVPDDGDAGRALAVDVTILV